MLKNRYSQLVLFALCLVMLSACGSNYVGRTVTMSHEGICKFKAFPATCSGSDNNFSFKYQIEKTGNPNEYKISGTANYIGGQTFTTFSQLSFTLLLVQDGIIAEEFGIGGGRGSLDSEITFSRTFVTPVKFDASTIAYRANVRG